jgi:NADH:ubiquinone oxidoreductase subunit 5 (subunit L)/multisubunit Na+/H+ antiporter MnhA subunit
MNQDLILFVIFSLVGLVLIGCLVLNQDDMPNVWKRGIYGGFIGAGLGATGLYVPRYIPTPCIIFALGMLWMLGHVLYFYYARPLMATATPEQIADRNEQRHNTLKVMAFGLAILLAFSVILAFTQGQQDSTRVQESFTGAMGRIASEISMLNRKVTQLASRVGELEKKADASAKGDSLARKQSFRNQAELLHRKR